MMESRFYFVGVLTLSTALVVAGCGEPTIDEEAAAEYVEGWSSSVEGHLQARAALAAGSEALESRIGESRAAEEREQPAVPFAKLVDQVYQERDYEPSLVGDQGLSEAGEAVWKTLEVVADHNLDAEPYELDVIAEGLEEFEGRLESVDDFDALEAIDEDRAEAIAWLVEQPESEFELSEDNYGVLTDALVDSDDRGDRLRQSVDEYQQKHAEIAESASVVEDALARGLARYAREQRHFRVKEIFVHPRHWDFYNEPDVDDSGRRPDGDRGGFLAGRIWRDAAHLAEEITEENEVDILDDRIRETVAEVVNGDEPEAVVAGIAPQQPQYAGLVAEHRRYREIVENGGWEEVSSNTNLAPGQSSAVIESLKERLLAEGYFPEDVEIDDTFDDALEEAIREYQKTHQLQVTGRPHHVFWYSLNIPAERRLEQIRLNLDRWRETNIKHELETYAFVNIPEFTVELWHEQERKRRHATIVGNNKKSMNPLTDEEEHSNRTPTPMAAYIDRVIFNPYWNVTKRIRAVRILPDVRESIEEKYALKLSQLRQQAQREQQPDVENVTLASIRAGVTIPEEEAVSEDPDVEGTSSGPATQGEVDLDDVGDEEIAAALGSDEEGEEDEVPSVDDLSEEERQELKQELFAEKRVNALAELTSIREVYNEEQERHEQKRFFDTESLRQLEANLGGAESEAVESLHARFPYLDWETGEVDVESTDPDNIPSWYEANGYEVVHPGHHTWEYVRMLPSSTNALGDVKIIFPNYDNIYLHDTPEKGLFASQVRGFSHGCVRVEDPLELSASLLELGGRDEGDRIDQILASEEYHPIFLERQIPVFLEYYTVSIDDEGRANFLADIYDYDDEALDG